jgi:transposase-like protein
MVTVKRRCLFDFESIPFSLASEKEPLMCPYCKSSKRLMKNGTYVRKSDNQTLIRFKCSTCKITVSETYFGIDYRFRKRSINQPVFKALCSGVSQRRCGFLMGIKPVGIARRVIRFGSCAASNLEVYRNSRPKATVVQVDEMESFEHTKCKPLTMPIAVEQGTRKILSLRVGSIAAKGKIAEISRAKYGKRQCQRRACLEAVLNEIASCFLATGIIMSDESSHYPRPIAKAFPNAIHKRCKGQRGCVTGQGELKRGGFDPLFTLNHSYAMFRDNLKTLSRRTWCTCKRPDRLQLLMYMYAWFHNLWLERKKRPVHLDWSSFTN